MDNKDTKTEQTQEKNFEPNLRIYNQMKEVPKEAQKEIIGGRLKGMTDINPMWRIQKLTEVYGTCGIGWKYHIEKMWIEQGSDNQQAAFCNISLYVKENGEWSDAIEGTGGSGFVVNERNGAYTNDEAFKMALTDAISVSCKALGMGANVYWTGGRTKYDVGFDDVPPKKPIDKLKADIDKFTEEPEAPKEPEVICKVCKKPIIRTPLKSAVQIAEGTRKLTGMDMCVNCFKVHQAAEKIMQEANQVPPEEYPEPGYNDETEGETEQ